MTTVIGSQGTGLLPDLEDMSLADLLDVDNPVLVDIMRRIAADDDSAAGIVAGFQSAI